MSRVRCLECGSARWDSEAVKCGKCGGAMALRHERCYVSEETISKLSAHADELLKFDVTMEEPDRLGKNFVDTATVIGAVASVAGVALYIGDRFEQHMTRDLVQSLLDKAVPKEEILKLRLDEPETILSYVEMDKPDATRAIRRRTRPAQRPKGRSNARSKKAKTRPKRKRSK
jgi:hypothetical protein